MNNNNTIIVLIILIFLSSCFSATETAFSCLNKIRLKNMAGNGDKKAEKTLSLAEDYNSLLSTVLVGNNIVNIVSSSLATLLFVSLLKHNGALVSSVVMTITILIFGEITPKSLAKAHPEQVAMFFTPFISILVVIFKPLTFILNALANLITSLFKGEESDEFRSEEFITMVEEAQEGGNMDEDEADLITNAIEFNDQEVGKVFTPRVDVVANDINDSLDQIDQNFRESGFSRIPIYDGSVDNIIGVLHEKDFYYHYYKDSKTSIKQIITKPVFTTEHLKISALLKQLQTSKSHMAVVIDEYGGTAGIITMEDVLEEIVGEIYDEHDEVIEYFKKINDNTYLVNCDADVEDMFEYFDITFDEEYEFNTVGGWVIYSLDRIPLVNDTFSYKNLDVTVTDADEKSVNEIRVVVNEIVDDEKDD